MTGLTASGFALPLRAPLRTARGTLHARRGFLVRARDAHGRVGLGEAAPLPPWTEDLKSCGAALDAAAAQLDEPLDDPLEALSDLDAFCKPMRGCAAARHGAALALLDLAAQRAELPLAAHLAATHGLAAPHPSPVPLNALLAGDAPEALAAAAARAVAEGFRAVKLKLAGTPADDIARVAAVRAAVGEAVEVRLDANGAWSVAEAEARLRALAPYRPAYVEQPVPADDLAGLRKLRGMGIVPVAADEAAATLAGARRVLDEGAADLLVVKPAALGGPDRAAEVLAVARARGVPVVVTTLLEGPVGTLGALHVAALLPAPRAACGLGALDLFDAPAPAGLRPRDGALAAPAAPGLGFGGA